MVDDDKSPAGETAEQKAKRKWDNHEIAKKYKALRKFEKDLVQADSEPDIRNAKVVSSDRDDGVEKQRSHRLDTIRDLRAKVKFLMDILKSGRTHTLVALEGDLKREQILAAYRFSLRQQRGRLAKEKLKRLNEGRWTLTKASQ